jgi:hypothetical protein
MSDDVQQVLSDTGIPELQPDYLQSQIDDSRSEIADAATELVTNPSRYEEVLDELAASMQERVDAIAEAVDEDAIAAAVAENTDLSEEEAEQAVDNAVEAAQSTADSVRQSIDSAQEAIADARASIAQFIDDARQTLDDASDAAGRAALWAFFGLLAGAAITSFAGLWGSRLVVARTESGRLRTQYEVDRT